MESQPPVSAQPSWFGYFQAAALTALCPLLVKSTSLLSALIISAAFAFTLCASSVCVSLSRRLIAPHSEVACILLIAAVWATVADLFLQATLFPMRDGLGIYLPLMACNSLLLVQLEEVALLEGPVAALRGSGSVAWRAGLLIIASGAIRELAATGQWLSDAPLVGWQAHFGALITVKLPLLASGAGAFIVLSFLTAAANRMWPERRVD